MDSMPEFHNMLLMNILKMLIGWEFENFSAGYGQEGTEMRQKGGRNENVMRKIRAEVRLS
jgi:hypothetical protein